MSESAADVVNTSQIEVRDLISAYRQRCEQLDRDLIARDAIVLGSTRTVAVLKEQVERLKAQLLEHGLVPITDGGGAAPEPTAPEPAPNRAQRRATKRAPAKRAPAKKAAARKRSTKG